MSGMDRGPDKGVLLGIPEVASYLGVSEVTVWRFCRDGTLPALRIGKQWRVRRGALEEFLRRSEHPATPAGQLEAFLRVPDNALAVAEGPEFLRRLDAAFLKAAESRGGTLVKFDGAEPGSEDELRAPGVRRGVEVGRLEGQGRFRLRKAGHPGAIWLSEAGLALGRLVPVPRS